MILPATDLMAISVFFYFFCVGFTLVNTGVAEMVFLDTFFHVSGPTFYAFVEMKFSFEQTLKNNAEFVFPDDGQHWVVLG